MTLKVTVTKHAKMQMAVKPRIRPCSRVSNKNKNKRHVIIMIEPLRAIRCYGSLPSSQCEMKQRIALCGNSEKEKNDKREISLDIFTNMSVNIGG